MDWQKFRYNVGRFCDTVVSILHYILLPFTTIGSYFSKDSREHHNERKRKIHRMGCVPITSLLKRQTGGILFAGEKGNREIHRIAQKLTPSIVLYRDNPYLDKKLEKGIYQTSDTGIDPLYGIHGTDRVDIVLAAAGENITDHSRAFLRQMFVWLKRTEQDDSLFSVLNCDLDKVRNSMLEYAEKKDDTAMEMSVHALGKEINILREYFAACADSLDGLIKPNGVWAGSEDIQAIYIDESRLGKAKAIILEAMAQNTDVSLILNNISFQDNNVQMLLEEHSSRLTVVVDDILSVCGGDEILAKGIMQRAGSVIMFQQTAFSAGLWSEYWGMYEYTEEQEVCTNSPLDDNTTTVPQKMKTKRMQPRVEISRISDMNRNEFYYQYKNGRGKFVRKYGKAW